MSFKSKQQLCTKNLISLTLSKIFTFYVVYGTCKAVAKSLKSCLRTFALIVCAQRSSAGNATVICHASLHVLVTIDWSRRYTCHWKRRGKKSHRFYSSCHRIPVVVVIDRAYENTRRGWTLLFTTSLAAWNYLEIPPIKTYARKPPL